ncbi:MAG: PAS domain-containing protein, partial [Beijerinckiaceae bacterium]|nr:PAS domain-containing protein [Beijerinckiaceae bacterium]
MAFAESGGKGRDGYLLDPIEMQALNVLPMPVVVIGERNGILYANTAAEDFFQSSAVVLKRQRLDDLIAFGSPVLALVEEVQRRGSSVSEYRLDLGSPRLGADRIVDVFASPLPSQGDAVVLMLQERTIAEKMDRQLTHR